MTEEEKRLSKQLEVPPEEVRAARMRLNGDRVLRALIADRLSRAVEEKRNTLETVQPEELKSTQGALAAFRASLALIIKDETK